MTKLETKIYDARISDLTETEHNPRQISKTDFDKLKKSLKDFPEMLEIREVVIDENNVILGGHQRVRAAKANGESTITVKQVFGLTDKQKREFIIKDNIANGDWDLDELANAWDDIPFDDWGLDVDWAEPKEIVEDAAPEVNESEPAKSELGKVYQLGEHRLMCGDSTSSEDVAKLMDGQKADMVFTDPPYGVNMQRSGSIMNDNLKKSELKNLLDAAIKNSLLYSNGNQYWFIGFKGCTVLEEIFIENGLPITNYIVWIKPSIGLGKNGYRYQHEICLFSGKIESNSKPDVWESNRDNSHLHPTMKPVKLPAMAIKDSEANSVLDLFGGSGSTLIACEQLGRKCYMMELDPKYCDVIRKRYWEFVNGSKDGWEESTPEVERS